MSTLVTPAAIGKEALMFWQNNVVLGAKIDWQYNSKFGNDNNQIGSQYSFRKPIQLTATSNNMAFNAANSALLENRVTLTLTETLTIPLSLTEADIALRTSLDDFSSRILEPSVSLLASTFDGTLMNSIINSAAPGSVANAGLDYSNISSGTAVRNAAGYVVGDYDTAMTQATILKVNKVLNDQAAPMNKLYGVLSSSAQAQLMNGQPNLFNPLLSIDKVYIAGRIGVFAGIDFAVSQQCVTHTNGAQTAITVTSGTLTSGWAETGTLTIPALTGAVKAGDVFQAQNIKLVNRVTGFPTDLPAQFQVLADAAIGDTTMSVSPAPISAGQYKNISGTLNGQAIWLTGASTVDGTAGASKSGVECLVFASNAIQAASPDMFEPPNTVAKAVKDAKAPGFKFRYVAAYDLIGASGAFGGSVGTGGSGMVGRFDGILGVKASNPAWIVRIRTSPLA